MAVAALAAQPALAHPHILVDARAAIRFDDSGRVVSIHHSWTFDAAYSAWSMQGLDSNNDGVVSPEEAQPLADDNMKGLETYDYYTYAGEGKDPNLVFGAGQNARIVYANGQSTLDFDVPLSQPYVIRKALEIGINDPEYYVAITFKDASAVELINAPASCRVRMEPAKEMPDELQDELFALPADVTQLPPDLEKAMRGMQGAIVVDCPGGGAPGAAEATPVAPATALDAVTALGEAVADKEPAAAPVSGGISPFGSAPAEPGLTLPRDGFLGWVSDRQTDFYRELTFALRALKNDWTAFWLLGGLSFLYGVFHAAGPGHGKVVISSYLFASEAELRRGVLLSFLAAMLQSMVAIGFVLVAAAILGMTAIAMSNAANWIGIISYGMVALLGLWLIARKIFGWGHHHHHHDEPAGDDRMHALARQHLGAPAHALAVGGPQLTSFATAGPDAHGRLPGHAHYGHAHGDDDEHGHVHVVMPQQVHGGWREQLGVVLAVGLRPCSGALIVLAFALSQGLLAAGIMAVLLMGVGTAITTGTLAALAVGAKGFARRLSGRDNPVAMRLIWWAELLGAFAVLGFGVVLLLASL